MSLRFSSTGFGLQRHGDSRSETALVVIDPIDALTVDRQRLEFTGHNCGSTIAFDQLKGPSITDPLFSKWGWFVGCEVQ